MKQDVLNALSGKFPSLIPSKETLNHPDFIEEITGIDPYKDTPGAFAAAWPALGIDIHVPLPRANSSPPTVSGGTWEEGNLRFSDMGVYPTTATIEYCPDIDKSDPDWLYSYRVCREAFLPDKQFSCCAEAQRQASFRRAGGLQGEGQLGPAAQLQEISDSFVRAFQDEAVMYHLYYTTLFMWPVVEFGWEAFLLAAASDPDRFDDVFWQPWSQISREYFEVAAQLPDEVIFCHDDLVMSTGPVFPPEFYEKYIFSRYEYILEPVIQAGKKIVFVCDGNLDMFLERLLQFPFAGLMYENPATSFDRVLATWGQAGRGFIGGISTAILTNGSPEEVRKHTQEVIKKGQAYPGFIISSCGGLHGNIPLENIRAYFKTRSDTHRA